MLGGSSENAQRQYAGDEEDLLLQYAIRQSLDTDTTASEQVEHLPLRIMNSCAFDLLKSWKRYGIADENLRKIVKKIHVNPGVLCVE